MHRIFVFCLSPALLLIWSALVFQACSSKEDAPLLEGKLDATEPTEVAIVYDYEGDNYVEELTTDSTGAFAYNPELAGEEADLIVYVGQDLYGAYVRKGSTVRMDIRGTEATFTGDHADRCVFNNVLYHAFSPWAFKPTPDHPFDLAEWTAKLEQGRTETGKAIDAIGDAEARARYQRLADAVCKYYLLQTLSLDQMMNQADHATQVDSLVASIDPNADESRLSGLINYWYNDSELHRTAGSTPDLTSYFIGQIHAIDSVLTNEGNKKSLTNTLCNLFFMYQPSDSAITAFRQGIAPQLAKAPRIVQNIEQMLAERSKQIKDGDALPSDPILIARDGSRTTLSEVIRGKVAYIDFWATWCAPCCREIPYFEKVWQQYKDNDQIVFVSVSQDDNAKAWEKKMDADHPQWPNYIFDKITGRQFLEAMGINAIPRFIIVGRDGRIISVDAVRPSDKEVVAALDAALAR